MAIICKTRCFVSNKNGEVVEYLPGIVDNKNQKWLATLNPIQRAKFEYVRKQTSREDYVTYERAEVEAICKLYLTNDNVAWVRDTFIANHPDQRHSTASVNAEVAQFRTLDRNYPDDTKWDVKRLTELVATELAPERFSTEVEAREVALARQAQAIIDELVA